jgi:hypothetical protein
VRRWTVLGGDGMQENEGPVDLLRFVEAVARRLPHIPRLAILDAVEAEWDRLCAAAEPYLEPLVVPAAVWRLRTGPHADLA